MKSLYITSVERYSGKTATCLALGSHFQADGMKIGYLKPLSLQPWRTTGPDGNPVVVDEDASFVKEVLGLSTPVWDLSPVVVTPDFLHTHLKQSSVQTDEYDLDLMDKVKQAYAKASQDVDLLLLEGGGSLREGYVVGLPTPKVAQALNGRVLVVVKYREEVRMVDNALAALARLGDALVGALLNRVPSEEADFVRTLAVPFLEKKGIPVFGVLPDVHTLSALTVAELIKILDAEVLTKYLRPQALVENMTVGAMTADAALSRFRRHSNKAVITGGDRTDIQLAALETSTTCLVLTGNLRPSPLVVKQAEEFGVAVLLVRLNTMETIEAIDRVFGRARMGETVKVKQYQALLEEHCDFERLYQALGLK